MLENRAYDIFGNKIGYTQILGKVINWIWQIKIDNRPDHPSSKSEILRLINTYYSLSQNKSIFVFQVPISIGCLW